MTYSTLPPAALITGSATGIGAAVARQLAARGFGVLIDYTRSEAEAEATAEACRAAGGAAVVCRGDVERDAECRNLVSKALETFGRIDALVNNAGTTKFVATTTWRPFPGATKRPYGRPSARPSRQVTYGSRTAPPRCGMSRCPTMCSQMGLDCALGLPSHDKSG